MTMDERSYFSVKGGQGVTTIAVADAALEAQAGRNVWLVTHDLGDTLAAAGRMSGPSTDKDHYFVGGEREPAIMTPATYRQITEFIRDGKAHPFGDPDVVIHDLGVSPSAPDLTPGPQLLVIRSCYLALRRALATSRRFDAIVLVQEPGRSLEVRDVESVLGVSVVMRVPYTAEVSRAVDAGLLGYRVPVALSRVLGGVRA